MIDVVRSLAALVDAPDEARQRIADALDLPPMTAHTHARVFLFDVYPYASAIVGAEGKLGGDVVDRIAGFLRVLGATPPPQCDHLVVLLDAYAELAERSTLAADVAEHDAWERARDALLVEHLLPWVPLVLDRISDVDDEGCAEWAHILDAVLEDAASSSVTAQAVLPIHLQVLEGVADPRLAGLADFLDSLLAPGRSGFIITARDLAVAAASCGLGLRIGERRFVITSLLGQDAPATLHWLAEFADAAAARYSRQWFSATPAGAWWIQRARATARLLDELANSE